MDQRLSQSAIALHSVVPPAPVGQSAAAADGCWVEVLIDCAGTQVLYTYAIPADLEIRVGDILSVPFGAQQVGAVAVRLLSQLPADLPASVVRPVMEVVSRAFFPADYWTLLHQVADYYCTPLMQVLRVALPPGLLGRSQRRIRLHADVIPSGAELFLHPSAQQLLAHLRSQKQGDYTWQYLQRQVRGASRGLRDLLQRGWVESYIEPPTLVRPKLRQAVSLTEAMGLPPPSPRQQEILAMLAKQGGEMWVQDLLQVCRTSSALLKNLEQKGWVVVQSREVLRHEAEVLTHPDQPKTLTAAQQAALTAIAQIDGYQPVLLHGVTGSGKTEIYLQAIAPVLQRSQSALVLVPEIGLTPQLTDRFRARFGNRVQVYHSSLSDGERYDTWRQMLQGDPQVVIGTRSAIFSPLPHLGLIVLDEEHDTSFKQDQPAPCYHARTVAHWRAALAQCPLILGSATPSLESWTMAMQGIGDRGQGVESREQGVGGRETTLYLSLPQRVHARPLPPIQVVDMRLELQQGNRSIFSRALQNALHHLQQQPGQQGILFIPRRGHSTFVSCRSCGIVLDCPHCDISLTYHQPQQGQPGSLRCHYCGYGRSQPSRCPDCDSPYLKHFGSGTQRVVQDLNQQFPELRCLRFDSDTTRTKGAHRALLSRFAQGEADLLVGTQMLTKGIDLPQVTLVGIVAADGVLHLPDFRASERTFQILTQVAGRSGRGDEPGQVILQTYSPQHPVIQAVQQQNYPAFAQAEQAQRLALGYPPFGHMILLRFSGTDLGLVRQTAEKLADQLKQIQPAPFELLGPSPATIMRVARRYRWHLLLKLPADGSGLPDWMTLRSQIPESVSLTIDVDPLNLL